MLAESSSAATPTQNKNTSCTDSNEPSAEGPVKYLRTAAAKKQYDFTANNRPTISSLSELIVQGLNSIRKAEEMNRESQLLLANSNKLFTAAMEQIQLLAYVNVFTFPNLGRVFMTLTLYVNISEMKANTVNQINWIFRKIIMKLRKLSK